MSGPQRLMIMLKMFFSGLNSIVSELLIAFFMDINPRFTEDYLPNRNAMGKNYQTSVFHFSLNDPNYMISFGGWHAYFGQLEGTIFIKKKKKDYLGFWCPKLVCNIRIAYRGPDFLDFTI